MLFYHIGVWGVARLYEGYMGKLLNLLAGSVAASVSAFGLASAQTIETIAAADVAAMLKEFEITSETRSLAAGQSPTIVATTAGGAKFLVGFFDCANAAGAAGCRQAMVSTAQSGAGASFEDLNAFNGSSSVTTVVYEASNQILIFGRNIFLQGGISRENFKTQIALFLRDMQNFANSRSGSTASVSFGKTPNDQIKSKIATITADEGAPLARRMVISGDGSLEVELAINNSIDATFDFAE